MQHVWILILFTDLEEIIFSPKNLIFLPSSTETLFKTEYKLLSAFVVIQSLSRVQLFATPWTTACQVSLSFTISQSLFKLMSIELAMPSNHLILCRPLLLVPSVFPNIGIFSNELTFRIRWPKYWSFSFCVSPSNEYSGLISFTIDWLDLLAVQGTLKSLLQNHSSQTSILWHSAFFYGPVLTCVHDFWKNHSFDYIHLCWQSNVSAF